MTAMPVLDYDSGWDLMLTAWAQMDPPDGWRTEIIEGAIVLTPPPAPEHNLIVDSVDRALRPALPLGTGLFPTLGVRIDPAERLYIPDLVVMPRKALVGRIASVAAEHALLVAEITSKANADEDRGPKKSAYAQGGIPLYLLIDRWAEHGPEATVFSDPAGFQYRTSHSVPIGDAISIPAPFDIELATSEFPPPRSV